MATRWNRYYSRQMKDPEMRELVEKELEALHVGALVARLRQEEGLNQTQFAARAGMSAPKISNIEKSPKDIRLGTLIRLAHAVDRKVEIKFRKAAGYTVAYKRK